ncbi:hypothetical protein BGY98DRAFT_919223 [Russula aff. rugulosa BPL654]|nr:hypothetical protein BGY98DRAFT_919223 [Russula aff. rugulosa BPL654]
MKRKGSPPPVDADGSKRSRKGKENDEFCSVKASIVLSVPPVFANRLRHGVEEMLDTMIMRYEPTLNGVVLAHSDVHFLDRVARLQADSPFAICHVGFDALIWKPTRGMKLTGRVTLCSPDHVSLLLHRTFNVSIPRHHIPADHWEFEYGPAENDPEFGNVDDDLDVDATEDVQEDDDPQATTYQRGRWVHRITGDRLGGKDRWLHFTVANVANQMLSLVGSIQPDPFSPEHIPQAKPDRATQSPQLSPRLLSEAIESEGMEEGLEETVATMEEEEETLATRGKKKREKEKEKVEKAKRKRKEDNAVAKSERKSKRKKTS